VASLGQRVHLPAFPQTLVTHGPLKTSSPSSRLHPPLLEGSWIHFGRMLGEGRWFEVQDYPCWRVLSHLTVSFESLRAKALGLLQGAFELLRRKLRAERTEGLSALPHAVRQKLEEDSFLKGKGVPPPLTRNFTTHTNQNVHLAAEERQERSNSLLKRQSLTWKLDSSSTESRSISGRSRLIDLLNSAKSEQDCLRTIKFTASCKRLERSQKTPKAVVVRVWFAGHGRSREKWEKQRSQQGKVARRAQPRK